MTNKMRWMTLILLVLLKSLGSPFVWATPRISGCHVFPADNIWNQPIDSLPLDPSSSDYIDTIGSSSQLHADFGSGLWEGAPIGIPFIAVSSDQPLVAVSFTYSDESDAGPYPIPPDAPIEGGASSTGDRHVLVLEKDSCTLFEMYYAFPQPDDSWEAGSGAKFLLGSNSLRPLDWTSADAAGLPILPGLVRYDEVESGEIRHAIRFTAPQTRRDYVWPARHFASSLTESIYPPMGQRFRLRQQVDITGFSAPVQVILQAMKTYGIILADNGSAWFISGVPDERWDNDMLAEIHAITGDDFEAVDVSGLMVSENSAGISDWEVDGCPVGDAKLIELVTYPDSSMTDCHAVTSIESGDGVLIGSGSVVSYSAPVVMLDSGFRVARNAYLIVSSI